MRSVRPLLKPYDKLPGAALLTAHSCSRRLLPPIAMVVPGFVALWLWSPLVLYVLHPIRMAIVGPSPYLVAPEVVGSAIVESFALGYFSARWIGGRLYAQIGAFLLGLGAGILTHSMSMHFPIDIPSIIVGKTFWLLGCGASAGLWLRSLDEHRVA